MKRTQQDSARGHPDVSSQKKAASGPSSEHGHSSPVPSTSRDYGNTTQQVGPELRTIQQDACMEDVDLQERVLIQNTMRLLQELDGQQEECWIDTKKTKTVARKGETRPITTSTITSAQSTSQMNTVTKSDTGESQATTSKQTASTGGSVSTMGSFQDMRNVHVYICRAYHRTDSLTVNSKTVLPKTVDSETIVPKTVDSESVFLNDKNALIRHMETHMDKEHNKCKECGHVFPDIGDLTVHMMSHTNAPEYVCDKYRRDLDRKHDLVVHKNIHSMEIQKKPGGQEECRADLKITQTFAMKKKTQPKATSTITSAQNTSQVNIQSESDTDQPQTTTSKQTAFSQDSLATMASSWYITDNKLYICQPCLKVFKDRKDLTEHMQTHMDREHKKCEVYNYVFTQMNNLSNHLFRHTITKDHECNEYGKRFKTTSSLESHKQIWARKIQEESCAKGSSSTMGSSQDKPKGYRCIACRPTLNEPDSAPAVFVVKEDLKRHMEIHMDKEKKQCKVCDKVFTLGSNLFRHMIKSHTDVKDNVCDQCGKAFAERSDLTRHRLTHTCTNVKDHKCKECGAAFKPKCHLQDHMKLHSGEKPFSCHLCQKRFIRNDRFKKHMATQHKTHTP